VNTIKTKLTVNFRLYVCTVRAPNHFLVDALFSSSWDIKQVAKVNWRRPHRTFAVSGCVLVPKSLRSEQKFDPFTCFCTAPKRNKQTDRRPRYGVIDRNSPRLVYSMHRPILFLHVSDCKASRAKQSRRSLDEGAGRSLYAQQTTTQQSKFYRTLRRSLLVSYER